MAAGTINKNYVLKTGSVGITVAANGMNNADISNWLVPGYTLASAWVDATGGNVAVLSQIYYMGASSPLKLVVKSFSSIENTLTVTYKLLFVKA